MADATPTTISSDGKGAILLPCEPDQFRDFIAGLLGQPQTITRRFPQPFEITRAYIENLHHLVEQRLNSQNEATLIQFTARIVYDDNSSVLLNSFYDFNVYNEVRQLQSTALHLSWTYLIQFRNKKFPEKQQIEISFNTEEAGAGAEPDTIIKSRDITGSLVLSVLGNYVFCKIAQYWAV